MDKYEKIIKRLDEVIADAIYPDRPRKFMIPLELVEETLSLLKEYEPIAPDTTNAGDDSWVCSNCGNFLYKKSWMAKTLRDNRPKYCSECGRKVKWE